MIIRRWTARATAQGAARYEQHFRRSVLPELAGIDGHCGAYLLHRPESNGMVEITVLTLWRSIESIRAFAGDDAEHAVVEPHARKVLNDFDDRASHHDVLVDTSSKRSR